MFVKIYEELLLQNGVLASKMSNQTDVLSLYSMLSTYHTLKS